ncbi:MAG: hypothetical protein H7Z12_20145 [Rhodospirillaceae bacterium]|nr:hypothetical protein [Rhodospirillales bacterium]
MTDAPSRVSGLEALLANRVLFKLMADCPADEVAEAYAAWLFHLAQSLGEETDWGDSRRLMEDSKWWFPEVEMAAFTAISLSEIAEESEPFLRLAIELFSAGQGVASRTDPCLQNAACQVLGTPTGRAAFDRLAEAVATQQPEQVTKAREAVLAGLHVEHSLPRSPGGSDDGAQPQVLYVETHAFLARDMSEIALVDTLSGAPRHLDREETQPLRDLVDAVFDHGRLRFHEGSADTLGRILVSYPSTILPPAFGIRGSGLIHAIPFAALPAGDGTSVGHVAVPVLLTGPDSRLEPSPAHSPLPGGRPWWWPMP